MSIPKSSWVAQLAALALLACGTQRGPATAELVGGSAGTPASTTDWETWAGEGAQAEFVETDGVQAVVSSEGEFSWSVGMQTGTCSMEKGRRYRAEFSVSGDLPKPLRVVVQKRDAPHSTYSGEHFFRLSAAPRLRSFEFTMRHESDPAPAVSFHAGKSGLGSVAVSNLRVTDLGAAPKLEIPTEFAAPMKSALGRGINLGSLDAPVEGEWAPEIQESYFGLLASVGTFDHVRIPVRWDTHAELTSPFTIDDSFFDRVDWAVGHALARGFRVVLNMHHFNPFEDDPVAEEERFLALWDQISKHYADYPSQLYLEIYNEPGSHLDEVVGTLEDAERWNAVYPKAYDIIREEHPDRTIVITGPVWGSPNEIGSLELPPRIASDPNIIVQFHFYHPAEFCFQGTLGNGFPETGFHWRGTAEEKAEIVDLLDAVRAWSEEHGLRIWNGEFTAHNAASDNEERLAWVGFVTAECEKRGIPWAYWDFSGDTSRLYHPDEKTWDQGLLDALTFGSGFPD